MPRLITFAILLASTRAAADPPARVAADGPLVRAPVAAAPAPAAAPAVAAAPAPAAADRAVRVANRWPSVPGGHGLSLEDQITDRLTEIGNTLGQHLDRLSHDMFVLQVDGRRRHAHVRFGGGDDELVKLRFDGEIQFDDLDAQVDAHFDLAFHGHLLRLELPAFEMQAAQYRGDYGVQIEVPLFKRKF